MAELIESINRSPRDRSEGSHPPQSVTTRKQCYYQVRKVGSKGALLVLTWTCLVFSSYINRVIVHNGFTQGAIVTAIFILCCPFAGWLADVYFGRYKVMQAGLWLMWVGSIAGVLAQIVEFEDPQIDNIMEYTALTLSAVLTTLGLTAFLVNAIAFGTDQMPDASSEEISAFIHWFVWAKFVGISITESENLISTCTNLPTKDINTLQALIQVVLSSLAICCDFLFRTCLVLEPESRNPLKLLFRVLRYAATHKYAIRRSAFTYCEDQKPSRIDFAKSKYGGPFTTEEVEDVKTCLRMLVVVVTICTLFLPGHLYLFSAKALQTHFRNPKELSSCLQNLISIRGAIVVVAFSIPLHELILYPCNCQKLDSKHVKKGRNWCCVHDY